LGPTQVQGAEGSFGPILTPDGLAEGSYSSVTFWANAAINSAWRRAAPW
jgi:hypothetical protein